MRETFGYGFAVGVIWTGLIGWLAYEAGQDSARQSMPQWAEVERARIAAEAEKTRAMWDSFGKMPDPPGDLGPDPR